MITLKQHGKKPKPEKASLVPSPISGTIPPVEHRFKPGQSGNPSGRPRILQTSLVAQLMHKEDDGRLKAEHVTENLIANAMSPWPHSVNAFRAIREVVEPTELEEGRAFADSAMARFVATIFHERLKPTKAIEV